MEPSLLLGSLAFVGAIGIAWWTLVGGRSSGSSIELGNYTIGRRDLDAVARRAERDDDPGVLEQFSALGRRLTPRGWISAIDVRILSAGSPAGWTTDRVLAFKCVVVFLGAFLVLLRLASGPTVSGILFTLAFAAILYVLPDARLRGMTQERDQLVRRSLAETVDQITIMVQAGLALDGAIARTARTTNGPLAAELTRVSQDVRAGIPRTQALLAMAERVQLPELRQVVTSIAQAEKLGVPIANTLQIQAAELREKRRQLAEERAMKLPVKILFPTVFCILPALFVVVLGPAVMNILDTLG